VRKEWDTIVIGAGVGGLTAAAKLVKEGQRVLVLDRNPHPGGTAYVYHRKGFSFPMGPLGFSHPERIKSILGGLGYDASLPFCRVHYRIKAFGLDIPISLPSSHMVKELSALFPSDAQGIIRFFRDVERTLSPASVPAPAISASEYLHEFIKDWRLRRILGSLGTEEPYSNFPLLASQWNLMTKEGIWYPQSGMRSFWDRLARTVTGHEAGLGQMRLGVEVAKINVKQGKVAGVRLKDGEELPSLSVISNGDFKTTFLRLLDPDVIPPGWHKAISLAKQTRSVLQVCLGIDSNKTDLSCFHEASRVIYRRGNDIETERTLNWNAPEVDPETLAGGELEFSLWSKDDRTLAPEGKDVIVIRTEADYSHFSRYKLGWRQRTPGYGEYKNRLARSLVREAQKVIPGLQDAIVMMDVATPLTFEDQGGRTGGAVAGWSWDFRDSRDSTPRELIRTPIKNLFMAGYQAYSALFLGGIPTAMESGKRAAEAVLTHADPTEEILLPGAILS
jgi:phytoene dehydrogenase-like protein